MAHEALYQTASARFAETFGHPHTVAAYAPGRVEVLGNHTDYNEGFVLSAAINYGTFFLASPSQDARCRLLAADVVEEDGFEVSAPKPAEAHPWANYVKGVVAGLGARGQLDPGFNGLFLGDVPLGSGLSSSAALEMSAGLALCALYRLDVNSIDLARIGQWSEHEYVGAKVGLLDQISSLFAESNHLVMSDFRSLEISTLPLGKDACFLICNTNVKHHLVDSEYNERRANCEQAAAYFASVLAHEVTALRDVSMAEWHAHQANMDPLAAKRSAHVIGENERVLSGRELLEASDLEGFGRLMFESHESSRNRFENSCPELDSIVDSARRIPGVMGARLSGGGFGGSAVLLIHPRDAEMAAAAVAKAYERRYGTGCDVRTITPSAGARVVCPG